MLRRPERGGKGHWTGVLETPSRPARQTPEQSAALTGGVADARAFPELHLYFFTYGG